MQKVNVKDIKIKTGTIASGERAGKPWELIIIIADDDSEFTTFDKKAKEVGIGGIIELEPFIKEGKTNFSKFNIIQKGQAPAATVNGKAESRSGMTLEMWAEKDRQELMSRERNACFMGLPELIKAKPGEGKALDVWNAAMDYARARFTPTPAAAATTTRSKPKDKAKPEATKSTSSAPLPDLQGLVFADAGKLKTACKDSLKMSISQIDKETAGFDLTTEKGRQEAWVQIVEIYGAKQDEAVTTEKENNPDPDGLFKESEQEATA